MTQPYRPGKIPVLLLHGTASNPAQWPQLVNGLMLDAHLRRHPLWVGLYHTGNPILYSAWRIRGALDELVADLDPVRTDEAPERMVVFDVNRRDALRELVSPRGVLSLGHVALPFPADGPVHGVVTAAAGEVDCQLGALTVRGESGTLVVPLADLARLRSNPLFEVVLARVQQAVQGDLWG
jgi:hypothetical protein